MIQLKTWVTNLMKLCARKDKSNTFLEPQEIENKLTITNSLISKNSIPSESTTGTVNSIEFRDATKNLLGAIECYRTLAEDLGIRLKLGSNYLGFRVSDEGIPTSFVNHPHDNGPDTQIATVKKVIDSVNQLRTELEPVITAEINQAIDVALEALGADLNRIIALLSKIGWDFDSTPTQNSIHGITSGGVYSFVGNGLNALRTELLNAIRNNSADPIASNSGVGQFKVGMIRSCFCIYGGNILPGDLISGSRLIYGNHKFQVEDDDKQWSLCSYFGEHRTFCELHQAISNGWTLPSNTTWTALAPCYGQDYGSTHGLFMCVDVR